MKPARALAAAVSVLILLSACAGAVGRRAALGLPPAQITPGPQTGSGIPGQSSSTVPGLAQPGGVPGGGALTGITPGSAANPGSYQGEVGVSKDRVYIGLFRGKSGAFAAIQTNGDQAMQAAFNEINDAGGIHGRKIYVKSYDDGSLNPSVIDANWRVAKNEVLAPFGQEGTYFIPHAERDHVPTLYGGALMKVGLESRYGFPLYPYVEYQSRALMPDYILNRLSGRGKRIAVIYDTFPANSAARHEFRAGANEAGLNIVIEQPVDGIPATCANEVSNVQQKTPDIVFLLVAPPAAICVFRDARALGFRPTWTGVAYTFATDAVTIASGGAADGVVVFGGTATLETPCGTLFKKAAQKYYPERGMGGDGLGFAFYLVGRRIIEHLKRAGPNLTREGLIQSMERSSGLNDGCVSPPTYGPGNRRGPLGVSLVRGEGERWVTIDPTWRTRF